MKLKPLQTKYGEVLFRSRLEARWAIYFDLLNLEWQYEPDGFALPEGNYCPDFLVNTPFHPLSTTKSFYIEIKPTVEQRNAMIPILESLYKKTAIPYLCVAGPPSTKWQRSSFFHGRAMLCFESMDRWGDLYYEWLGSSSADSDFVDEKEWQIAANYRFENGVAKRITL